ncbi:hypothetical protein MSG28_000949 [Choristoneura fumiferana]|uniref:Uncharacterized protein n=1 Tax=Choristoneura fumiferana TaxID=7141 RepID=A0ACC0K3E6_CHOFU|nr:hypothetical protein MSG28_000949 [Choristoneura fumiferana]
MSRVYEPSDYVVEKSRLPSFEKYKEMHKQSLEDPETFWSQIANEFHWQTPAQPGNFVSYNFDLTKGNVFVKWMEGAVTNICFNLLDRNVRNGHGEKIAYYWEGNHPDDYSRITYRKLMDLVCQFANALRDSGVGKGDRVSIYMPMILETVVCMLACARIGAIHSVVFAGFSSDSLSERMASCKAKVLVTADGAWRGEKLLVLKNTCDEALQKAKTKHNHTVDTCVVVSHLARYKWDEDRDIWWHDMMDGHSTICPPEWMGAEEPLFMLYTSGSTGKPKGVLHTTAGYLLYATATFRYVFDYREKDIYWCTADVGWITGHTYVVYAPLANAATSVLFEGTPFYPDNDRYWSLVDKYKVSQFYTAPTAIRTLTKFGDHYVQRHDMKSLRILGSVGEPINPEAWLWYYNLVGNGRCSGFPFFGVEPTLLDESGAVIEGPGARRDEDGFLWVTGRVDDMLNVSGHLMSTAEVEGVLCEDPRVTEAAVVSKPHPIKGESLYCFVILVDGAKFDADLLDALKKLVRARIGAFAVPDVIQNAPGLPKTRSGKIMRRILRKIALGDRDVGDTSTLAEPAVVDELFNNRP